MRHAKHEHTEKGEIPALDGGRAQRATTTCLRRSPARDPQARSDKHPSEAICMTSVAQRSAPVAYCATFAGREGLALRDTHRRVWFREEATHTWQALSDADAPALVLHGRVDIAEAQARIDGELCAAVMRRHTHAARTTRRTPISRQT
jgi:hypothetical protein